MDLLLVGFSSTTEDSIYFNLSYFWFIVDFTVAKLTPKNDRDWESGDPIWDPFLDLLTGDIIDSGTLTGESDSSLFLDYFLFIVYTE